VQIFAYVKTTLTVDNAGRKISVLLKGSLMKRSFRPRKTANLPDSVVHRLNLYALAASAAGVGVLALAQSAEAKIVYTKTHVVIGTNNIYELDLNHDGLADFKIDHHSFFTDTIVATLSAFRLKPTTQSSAPSRRSDSRTTLMPSSLGRPSAPNNRFPAGGWLGPTALIGRVGGPTSAAVILV
jgi:hypothetical protein